MDVDKTLTLTAYSYWEIAFIYAFTVYFDRPDLAPTFPVPFFTPKILEDALANDSNGLLSEIMCAFLANSLNRKKPIVPDASARPLSSYIATKVQSGEFDLGYNPLSRQESFDNLAPDLKLKILHALVEWQLQDSTSIRTIVETVYNNTKKSDVNPLAPTPIGYDSQKRAYWQFGDSAYMWRERANLKSGCEWEIVCRDMDELQKFATDILQHSKSHHEKNLAKKITHTLIPGLEEKQAIQARKDRQQAKKISVLLAQEDFARTLPRRERRKPARYNYNEDVMDDDQEDATYTDDEEDKGAPKKQYRPPTRSSRRLNGSLGDEGTLGGNDYIQINSWHDMENGLDQQDQHGESGHDQQENGHEQQGKNGDDQQENGHDQQGENGNDQPEINGGTSNNDQDGDVDMSESYSDSQE